MKNKYGFDFGRGIKVNFEIESNEDFELVKKEDKMDKNRVIISKKDWDDEIRIEEYYNKIEYIKLVRLGGRINDILEEDYNGGISGDCMNFDLDFDFMNLLRKKNESIDERLVYLESRIGSVV